MRTSFAVALLATACLVSPSRVYAQQPAPGPTTPAPQSDTDSTFADQQNRIGENHFRYVGHFEYERGDVKIYADTADLFRDENRLVLEGNVVFRQGTNQISADRAEINTSTRLGTFYNATGFATVKPPAQTVRAGAVAPPPPAGQENVVLFFGDTVEKTGPKRYKIVNGGFTTCVQPTPRWNLSGSTIVLNVDHYTFLRNAVMTVKGVPMLYLPVVYYPTKKEDRATGFLLPAYGSSTLRGQTISNAFFWAIDRSQDATFMHDWFSKTGQGTGGEYRYNFGGGSDGNIRAYLLNEHEVTYVNSDGSQSSVAATRSYEVRGTANQLLPGKLRARARVDYFSSIVSNQSFNTNVNDASRSQRNFGGNIVGAWSGYTLNGTFDHNEYFYSQSSSNITGSWPRFTLTRNERPIAGTPFYLSVGGEYAHILSNSINTSTTDDVTTTTEVDQGLTRFDFNPQIRFPFKKWQWFTVNSTASWRETYYSRSYDPLTIGGATTPAVIDEGLNRLYFTVESKITGPVFSRIFDTPGNGYAEKFKHSVEPYLNVQRTSSIDGYDRIVKLEGTDQVVGGTTQLTYGFANRFYAKRRATVPGQAAQAREIFTVDLQQTYYTNDRASTVDRQYQTSNSGAKPTNFSPIALSVRGQPSNDFNITFRSEFDPTYRTLRSLSTNGNYSFSTNLQTSVGWSKTVYIPELTTYDNSAQSINVSTNVKTRDNKYGGLFSFNYDIRNSTMIQQRMSGYYNAQCCGIALEYQIYNSSSFAIASDHRFFLSFTLAGLGNFSPFNGALSGVPR